MPKRIIPATYWGLKHTSQGILTELTRQEGNEDFLRVGENEIEGVDNLKLWVPERIRVYHVTCWRSGEHDELFFSTLGEQDLDRAYLTRIREVPTYLNGHPLYEYGPISGRGQQGEGSKATLVELLSCPVYCAKESGIFLEKAEQLRTGRKLSVLHGFSTKTLKRHPLIGQNLPSEPEDIPF